MRKIIVCSAEPNYELELDDVTLMFLDTVMAQLNAGGSQYFDYFEYEDEDGERLSVRTDEELSSMVLSTESDEPIRVFLKSTKPNPKVYNLSNIRPDSLHRTQRLGSGQFGTVYRAIDENDYELAVKCISDTGDFKTNMSLLNEIEILKFYGASLEEGEWLIRVELMDGLSLDKYGQIPPNILGSVSVAIVNGLKYLWDLKIMHRDVKPSNFLVNTKGDVKLSDFGVSRQMVFSAVFSEVGTNKYMAPERISCQKYKEFSDVWSLGLSMTEMALGHFPFDHNTWLEVITSNRAPNIDVYFCGEHFQQFVERCVRFDPSERIKPDEILQAKYIAMYTPINTAAMRNLIIRNACQNVPDHLKEQILGCNLFCADINGKLYFLLRSDVTVYDKRTDKVTTFPLAGAYSEVLNAPNVCIFDILADSEELCIIFESGNVFLIECETGQINECGCIEDQVAAGAWSPDMQTLIVATKSKLISLSREFETNAETGLFPDYAGTEELQTVGWGSAETQFQGQAGKANREKVDANVIPTENHKFDSGSTLICWRPDSQLIATSTAEYLSHNAIEKEVLGRRIRIWDRELQFLSCCQILAGIEPVLTFRPGRNHILTTRLFEGERSIWFFEQNGQYRYNSAIKINKESNVRKVQFDLTGTILMLLCRTEEIDEFQFWAVSNTEWTIKSCIRPTSTVLHCFFSQEIGGLLHYITTDGQCWSVEIESNYTCEDGLAISVAGDTVRFTDLKKAPVPPPMCHNVYNCVENISNATLGRDGHFAVLTSQLRLIYGIFRYGSELKTCGYAFLAKKISEGILYNLNWCTDQVVTTIWSLSNSWKVMAIHLTHDAEIEELYHSEKNILFQEYVKSDNQLYLLDADGQCYAYNTVTKSCRKIFGIESKQFHQWTRVRSRSDLFITQNATYTLYCNGKSVLENCRSYVITPEEDMLLATTLSDKLIVIKMSDVQLYLSTGDQKSIAICGTREIENGAILVGHEPGFAGTMCWLQMPRGNLEQIHPRPVLIERLKVLILNKEYHEAMTRMRRHRVNMNLLVDLDPNEFRTNISEFVNQFNYMNPLDADLLNIFISSLEEDSLRTKISDVCNLLRSSILAKENETNDFGNSPMYTVVLSCIVRCGVDKVVDALMDIKCRADQYADTATKTKFLGQSLRHLCYIVSENILFESAFRTYDLNIVSMIADKQQKDPKEYVPIINELRSKTPDRYRNYCICLRLKDWSEALKQIALVPEKFDECIQHINQHVLYVDALSLFRNSEQYKEICRLFAVHLFNKAKYKEAAIFFEKCGELDQTFKCYELSIDFRGYISAAGRYERPTVDVLSRMLSQLERREDFAAVAEIYSFIDEKTNAEKIVESLVKASLWRKATDCALKHNANYDIKTIIRERSVNLIRQVSEWRTLIDRHISRLIELRLKKEKMLENWMDAKDVDLGNETISEASSAVSSASRMSTMSSRRRKNISKKKSVIKEGSQYEDAAILVNLKGIYKSVDDCQDELVDVIPALVTLNLIDEASMLEKDFEKMLEFCEVNLGRIWPQKIRARDLPGPIAETYRCEDGIVRMPEAGCMPTLISLEDEMIRPTIRKNVKWKTLLFVV